MAAWARCLRPAPRKTSGVQASNNVPVSLGSMTWSVNKVASFAVGDVVNIAWADPADSMTGPITAVDPVGLTITVDATSITGDTGIPWAPWQFTLISQPAVAVASSAAIPPPPLQPPLRQQSRPLLPTSPRQVSLCCLLLLLCLRACLLRLFLLSLCRQLELSRTSVACRPATTSLSVFGSMTWSVNKVASFRGR